MFASSSSRVALALGLLCLAVVAVYAQVWSHAFLNFDDNVYVSQNARVLAGLSADGVAWAWTTHLGGHFHPLTWMSLMLDVSLFGPRPGAMVLVNVALHCLVCVLMFATLHAATRRPWPSLLAVALFALHPLRVESVAWMTERKDVLSSSFGWFSLWAYVRYATRSDMRAYAAACVAFSLALFAKPTWVVLPALLVVIDVWLLGRGLRWIDKMPFAALALCGSLTTLWAQGASGAIVSLPVGERLGQAMVSGWRYLGMMAWPVDLAAFYPRHSVAPSLAMCAFGACVLAVVLLRHVSLAHVRFGAAWFCIASLPILGLIQAGGQSVADRFTYLPSVGVSVAVAWQIERFTRVRVWLAPALAVLLATVSWRQVGYWKNSETLFRHALDVTGPQYFAANNLGEALDAQGRLHEAGALFAQAVDLNPSYPEALNNYGTYLARTGRIAQAAEYFARALSFRPDDARAHYHLGLATIDVDRASARRHLVESARLNASDADVHHTLGAVLEADGDLSLAAQHYAQLVALRPGFAEGLGRYAHVLACLGKPEAAHYRAAGLARDASALVWSDRPCALSTR